MGTPIKLDMVGRVGGDDNEYFFTRPNMPCLVDLSKVVIFVHPYEKEGGGYGAELVIKTYEPKRSKKQKPRPNRRTA